MTLEHMVDGFCEGMNNINVQNVESAARLVLDTMNKKKNIFICGNGGSGANANLFAGILSKTAKRNNYESCILSLNSSMAAITSVAESEGYKQIFRSQIENMTYPGDLLICISGSGNSPNILEAALAAHNLGIKVIGLTGMGGGKLSKMADIPVVVESDNMEQIENIHTAIIYAITLWVDEQSMAACKR
ncbi:D-sedoheptulose-7-phosphate isomerase [Acetivibrio straminisolvens]|uniref:Phosphoheptose isomerase n=1 Tax=Acetivibrio straminisolvens JCM 21531 TaxID=1294263 RepID=W4UZN0_9FIRM|nr:SIS domain-containing protein [Acetivibrio straminisolvens]GAE86725.1 phosphoheptose isomerase [Acetivibrio straminisolvens JCM 21531]